ncbi:MAG: hypothetical protein GY917_07500 [Planctomycetaceae bacterium]|nr:hypothetical protein [Planctomycetaceae bacterium]
MICPEVETEEGQLKTTLPLERPVAVRCITAKPPQEWHHVLLEIWNITRVPLLETQGNRRLYFLPMSPVNQAGQHQW